MLLNVVTAAGAMRADAAAGAPSAPAQLPDEGTQPPDVGGEEDEEFEEDLSDTAGVVVPFPVDRSALPDTLRSLRPDSLRTALPDSLRAAALPDSLKAPAQPILTPGSPATPSRAGSPVLAPRKERRGIFGLHPAVLVLGLVVAHVLFVSLVTGK